MAPRTMATATDEAKMPIFMAGERWDIMIPSAWSIENKKDNKNKK
jgi:hypothetical protein